MEVVCVLVAEAPIESVPVKKVAFVINENFIVDTQLHCACFYFGTIEGYKKH